MTEYIEDTKRANVESLNKAAVRHVMNELQMKESVELKELVYKIVNNCVETTIIGHYPYLRAPCLHAFIEEYLEEKEKKKNDGRR